MTWGSALDHQRSMKPLVGSFGRKRCPWCPKDRPSQCTHVGLANGVAMVVACFWHVRMWVRDPRGLAIRNP